jgi:glycosyltransferase involved in cell wall biosynthesis
MNKKINLLLITPCFGYGGLEQVVLNLINELDRSKFNVSICTLLEPHPEMLDLILKSGVKWNVINKKDGFDLSIPLKLANLIRKGKIDLINSHDVGATLYAVLASLLTSKKTIVHTDHSEILGRKHLYLYSYIMRKRLHFCITVSENLRHYLINNIGVCEKIVKTIPNGIDLSKFSHIIENTDIRREFHINKNDLIIGSIGRLTKQKGYEYLLKAFNLLLKNKDNVKLVIAGDGEDRDELMHMAKELQVAERVIFAGHRKDIPNIIRSFDVFVLSSLWEGQPITIIEAMAAGVPIVVTDVGGNSEILGKGSYGLLVPPRDPVALARGIENLLNDSIMREKISTDAQMYAKNHLSHLAMVKEYEKVFDSLK